MDVHQVSPDDTRMVTEVVDLLNAVRKVDEPWGHTETVTGLTGLMRHGWDGEAPRWFAAEHSGRLVATAALWASEWDNRHLGWLWLHVHPDVRRAGHGTALLADLTAEVKAMGRGSLGADGWDADAPRAFGAAHGFEVKSTSILRRQHLDRLDRAGVDELAAAARDAASAYELVGIEGHTPPDLLDDVAAMTAAINDAPTDDLDYEDEVFTRERIANYETAQLGRGHRLYRLVARHRDTGELAGHTVVAVEIERPAIGHQHDTSVVRAHRGHRLGLLLKSEMLRWLADVEPQLRTIDTWNAESNDHMIAVNELLGYEVLARELSFQRSL